MCAEGRRETGAARKMVDRVNIFEGRRCEKLYFEVKRVRRIVRGEVQVGGLDVKWFWVVTPGTRYSS